MPSVPESVESAPRQEERSETEIAEAPPCQPEQKPASESSKPAPKMKKQLSLPQMIAKTRQILQKDGVRDAVTYLMKHGSTDWTLAMTEMYSLIRSRGCTQQTLLEHMLHAYRSAPRERQLAIGDLVDNQQMICVAVGYMKFCATAANGGTPTPYTQIAKILDDWQDADLVKLPSHSALDKFIVTSCLPTTMNQLLSCSRADAKVHLSELIQNLSWFSAKTCAAIMIKLAHVFAEKGAMSMILAIAASPLSSALKHIELTDQLGVFRITGPFPIAE